MPICMYMLFAYAYGNMWNHFFQCRQGHRAMLRKDTLSARTATAKDIYCILSAADRRVLRRWWICCRRWLRPPVSCPPAHSLPLLVLARPKKMMRIVGGTKWKTRLAASGAAEMTTDSLRDRRASDEKNANKMPAYWVSGAGGGAEKGASPWRTRHFLVDWKRWCQGFSFSNFLLCWPFSVKYDRSFSRWWENGAGLLGIKLKTALREKWLVIQKNNLFKICTSDDDTGLKL